MLARSGSALPPALRTPKPLPLLSPVGPPSPLCHDQRALASVRMELRREASMIAAAGEKRGENVIISMKPFLYAHRFQYTEAPPDRRSPKAFHYIQKTANLHIPAKCILRGRSWIQKNENHHKQNLPDSPRRWSALPRDSTCSRPAPAVKTFADK